MDQSKRIEELEAHVRRLNHLVSELLETREEGTTEPADTDVSPPAPPSLTAQPPHLVEDVRQKVERALGGNPEEPIESRIGSVWLSRLAVVLAMTAIALTAQATFKSAVVGPPEKTLIFYAMAILFVGYGFFFSKGRETFGDAILGCGLAGIYFTTYAIFFVEEMRLHDEAMLALPLLVGCLALLAGVAHWRKSQAVAGIGLFLAYYTVVVSCRQAATVEALAHALLTCTVLAVVALAFHAAHRWMLFSWVALIATHLTYIFFFLNKPEGLEITDSSYFWLSNGFLTVCFILFSLTCIIDARKTGEYRRMVAPMSGVNSAVFLCLTYIAIRDHYPEQQWMFRLGVAALLLVFAIFAETTGPRRNYLFQVFIAKTVIMFTLALQAYLADDGEILRVAMAIECLALAFSYKRSGVVVFKVLALIVMAVTFVLALFSVSASGAVELAGYSMPANWFSAVGVAFVFSVVACFYEKFVRRLKPEKRRLSGQWFLADTFLDLRGATMAIVHAAAAALIILTTIIFERGDDPALPFLLAGAGLVLAALGLILRTPQVEVASVLLLVAAHVCYHVFLRLPIPAFEYQPNFVLFTTMLVLFSYGGAYTWERYLKRYPHRGPAWEHHLVAALPYLAATYMLTTLLARHLPPLHVPASQGGLGMALLLVGTLTGLPAVKASGILALAMGTLSLYMGLYQTQIQIVHEPDFLLFFILFLVTYVGSERLIVVLETFEQEPARWEELLRTLLVALVLVFGVAGLRAWSPPNMRIFYLLGHAVVVICLGAVFRESRYRWGALFLFAIVIVSAFAHFSDLSDFYQVLTFAAASAVLLVVSWSYTRVRRRHPHREETEESRGAATQQR